MKILVIRLSAMGDVAMTVPVLRCLVKKYPDAKITLVSKSIYKPIFKEFKTIDFFDVDFKQHAIDIYDKPKWPEEPLFYANFPSITDETAAPKGMEAGFFLIPLAPGIEDTEELREEYFLKIISF